VDVILRYLGDSGWHETILLAVGALGIVAQQPLAAGQVLHSLCEPELEGEARGRNVTIAGEALLDVGEVGVGRRAAVQITNCLVQTMQNADTPPRTRRQTGLILGRLGWLPDDLDAFVEISPGPFLYGDGKESREIAHRYWIGKYPVTNAQYARFIEANGYHRREFWSDESWAWREGERGREEPTRWNNANLNNPIFPVVSVTWFEAQAYCRWLTTQRLVPEIPLGYVARLPTEEEWERAVRFTDGREYPWGDEFEVWRANIDESDTKLVMGILTTAVCTYPQGTNPEGLLDGAGNVWEWTASRWDPSYVSPRVLGGGSWLGSQGNARCAYRGGFPQCGCPIDVGFRVVVSLIFPRSDL